MKTLIPNRLLFRFEFPLRYRSKPPQITGKLTGWSDAELLPELAELDGETPFAPVWSCWNERGIYVAMQVTGKRSPLRCDTKAFWKGDNLRLMLDMRDTRNIKRAGKFCQHFYFLPSGGSPAQSEPGAPATGRKSASRHRTQHSGLSTRDSALSTQHFSQSSALSPQSYPIAASAPINRAKENAPPVEPGRIKVASTLRRDGYKLEAHIPADCLSGFDPDQHRRVGFYYILEDRDLGRQSFTIGDDLPWHVDPSLWATAVLDR